VSGRGYSWILVLPNHAPRVYSQPSVSVFVFTAMCCCACVHSHLFLCLSSQPSVSVYVFTAICFCVCVHSHLFPCLCSQAALKIAAPPSIVVKCGGVVLRVVVCGVVLVVSCVVSFLLCVCVCDLFLFLRAALKLCCSCCVFVCMTVFSSYRRRSG